MLSMLMLVDMFLVVQIQVFCRDVDVITLGIDEVIELVFLERYFEGFIYGKIWGRATVVQNSNNYGIGCFVADGLSKGFGRDTYEMTLGIDKVI